MTVIGDARRLPFSDGVAQCVVTSPPYYGLRDYGVSGQIGLEQTPAAYVDELVATFREVRRVMRDDGVVWLNLGDSYAMSTKGAGGNGKQHTNAGSVHYDRRWSIPDGAKPKDLLGIPWRVAFALQDDGWYLRSDCIWHKPNPMPESVTDRPTKAHEYVFLLSKQARYFYDAEAVSEPSVAPWEITKSNRERRVSATGGAISGGTGNGTGVNNGRNARTVWTIATQPYSGAHFATMPPKMAERCILAGTSQRGACPKCGAAWVREVKKTNPRLTDNQYVQKNATPKMMSGSDRNDYGTNKTGLAKPGWRELQPAKSVTTGWRPACDCAGLGAWPDLPDEPDDGPDDDYRAACDAVAARRAELMEQYDNLETRPCIVLDPFSGSGTTERVSISLGRRFIGTELNARYVHELRAERTAAVQVRGL